MSKAIPAAWSFAASILRATDPHGRSGIEVVVSHGRLGSEIRLWRATEHGWVPLGTVRRSEVVPLPVGRHRLRATQDGEVGAEVEVEVPA